MICGKSAPMLVPPEPTATGDPKVEPLFVDFATYMDMGAPALEFWHHSASTVPELSTATFDWAPKKSAGHDRTVQAGCCWLVAKKLVVHVAPLSVERSNASFTGPVEFW